MTQESIWGWFMKKKSEAKNLVLLSLKTSLGFHRNRQFKNIFGWFLKTTELRKRDKKVVELAKDCRVVALRKSNFEGLQSQFRNFFSPQFCNHFGCPQYRGIAEVRTKIVDAHLCLNQYSFKKIMKTKHFNWKAVQTGPTKLKPEPAPEPKPKLLKSRSWSRTK